jgi:hypothetical protein
MNGGVPQQKVIIPATTKPKLMSSGNIHFSVIDMNLDKKLDNRLKRNLGSLES